MTDKERNEILKNIFNKYAWKTQDSKNIKEKLNTIKEQYEIQEKQIEELQSTLKNFKADVYKDEELQAMKKTYKCLEDEYYRGFPITEKQKKRIQEWIKQHEDKYHGGYPCYHGANGGGYEYRFYPTAIGTSAEIVCTSCNSKVLKMWYTTPNEKTRYEICKEYDSIFCFQEIE